MLFRNHVFSSFMISMFMVMAFHFSSNQAFAEAEYIEYKVVKNDTLSKILKTHSLKPIYGKLGSLEEALKLNPKKQKTQGDLIIEGEILILPKNMNQAEGIDHKKHSQASIRKEKQKIEIPPTNEELTKKQKTKKQGPQKQEPQKQTPIFKATEPIKEKGKQPPPQPQIKIVEKTPPQQKQETQFKPEVKKPVEQKNVFVQNKSVENKEAQFKPETKKPVEQKNVFVQNKPVSSEKENMFNPNAQTRNQENKSKSPAEFLTFSKTQLPAMPVKSNEISSTKETNMTQRSGVNSSSEMEYHFMLDSSGYCNPNPSCKLWLWEQEDKCCKPTKRYFIFYEKNSL